jgi:hypothetical protein
MGLYVGSSPDRIMARRQIRNSRRVPYSIPFSLSLALSLLRPSLLPLTLSYSPILLLSYVPLHFLFFAIKSSSYTEEGWVGL